MLFVGCVKEHTKIGRSSPLTSRLMISTLEIFIEFVMKCRTVSRDRYVYSLSFIFDTFGHGGRTTVCVASEPCEILICQRMI